MDNFFTYGFNVFIISSIVTIIFTLIFNGAIRILINRFNKRHPNQVITNQYILQTARFVSWLVALMIIFKQIEPLNDLSSAVLGATSIVAIAISIAAQATFGNYVAGFTLSIHKPFEVGDIIFIKERGLAGTVKEINFRHTIIETQEHTEIIIPNTIMNSAVIEDMSNNQYSELIHLKVPGETDLVKLNDIINELIKDEELIDKTHSVKLTIHSMDKNGFDVAFPIRAKSIKDATKIKNDLYPKLYKALKDNKIELI